MPQPEEIAALSAALREAYSQAWQELTDEAESIALDLRKQRRRARLRELLVMVEERMDSLDLQAAAWLTETFRCTPGVSHPPRRMSSCVP